MDGVILDSEVLARRLWHKMFESKGLSLPNETYKLVIGRTMAATREVFEGAFGSGLPWDEMFEVQDRWYHEEAAKGVPLKSGVVEILEYLKSVDTPLAVGSSTCIADVKSCLNTAGVIGYFDVLVGGDQVDDGKPAPDIFLKCAKLLDVASADCLVIEDSKNGIRGANAADIPVVMIPDQIPAEDLDGAGLDFSVYSSLRELKEGLVALSV